MNAKRWLRPEPVRDQRKAAAVALLPLMILGLLLSALWNPQDRLDTVPAAIVNLDEPVEVDGQLVPLGRQLAAGLVSGGEVPDEGESAAVPASDDSYDWRVTDAEDAASGLADGEYAAVVTIPEGFSSAATSYGGDDPSEARKATIDVATAPDGRILDDALAQIVAQTATSVLGDTLTETYVDNVLVGFSTLSGELGTAADGAGDLADGASEAGDGAEQLADGARQASDGAAELGDGAGRIAGGAGELAGGAGQWAGGASEWAAGASQWAAGADALSAGMYDLAGGVGRSAMGANQLADGAQDLSKGAQQLAGGSQEFASKIAMVDQQVSDLSGEAQDMIASLESLGGDLEQLAAGIAILCGGSIVEEGSELTEEAQAQLTALCDKLAEMDGDAEPGIDKIMEKLDSFATGADDLADGSERLAKSSQTVADGVTELASGVGELSGGLTALQRGANDVAAGTEGLANGAQELAAGATGLAGGASELSSGAGGLANGVSGLAAGAGDLSGGIDTVAAGTDDLATGIHEMAGGAGDLSDGLDQATEELPAYSDAERRSLASVVADPVEVTGASELGTGATGPMFAVLALWLGALGVMLVFPPVPFGARGSTRGPLRLALGALALPAAIGVVTGAVTGAILAAVEGLDAGGWAAAITVGTLVSVAFVVVNQALAAGLGHVGRGISLVIAVLVIAAGVVSTAPAGLRGLAAFLPVGAAQEALAAITEGSGGLSAACAALVVWALAALAATTLAVSRSRTVRAAGLRQA
ncbi:YhgE/Pip domain-containing protein [Myceligenerans salitolerans]|uniref:YhgE/Pip domain-containing protein n=1 Tax=Myceligenerans salitolerans TaxID=1230528 RepID=A0ABS3I930_9MICO|nr:YhgE/Pip domain-containing protein [Myceligenerans salitolerans]MBO0609536.1 YhgE/Pip domain-containing protein [Myceligenerans salitolerans]